MQPVPQERQVTTRGVQRSGNFGISQRNASWIKAILRDKIYTDKILAVVREYSANAWDANRMQGGAGADVPIVVTMPTQLEPHFRVRDNGPGLSEEDVFTIYTQYGESTKRSSNNAVGMLGIGSKSAFAYSDQFTITSFHRGTKAIYTATLTDTDDSMVKLGEWPSAEPSGIEIMVPVSVKDVGAFADKARLLFPYFDPPPKINISIPQREKERRVHGFIVNPQQKSHSSAARGGHWIAVMGCIPYTVNIQQIKAELGDIHLWKCLQQVGGGLYFDIGDVEIAASREELEYSDHTKAAVLLKFQALIEEYVDDALSVLASSSISAWDKRLKARFMAHTLGFPVPARYRKWSYEKVYFTEKEEIEKEDPANPGQPILIAKLSVPKKFTLRGTKGCIAPAIYVNSTTKVYMKDTTKHLSGYPLKTFQVVVCPNRGSNVTEARAEFQVWAKKLDVEGVTVENISTLYWMQHTNGRTPNRKYSTQSFKMKDRIREFPSTKSDNWEVQKRTPNADDVFVIIYGFTCVTHGNTVFRRVLEDRKLCMSLGLTMPEIYGYKTTHTNPVQADGCLGTEYATWRKTFFRATLNSTRMREISDFHWAKLLPVEVRRTWDYQKRTYVTVNPLDKLLALVRDQLGVSHPISCLVANNMRALKTFNSWNPRKQNDIHLLASRVRTRRRPASLLAFNQIMTTYPMLEISGKDLQDLVKDEDGAIMLDYIKQTDRCGGK